MAGSICRDLIQSQRADERWKMKETYWSQNYQGIEGVSIGQKYKQGNVFISNGGSNEKFSLKLAVPKFPKRSFQILSALKSATLLKKMNPFTMNLFLPSF